MPDRDDRTRLTPALRALPAQHTVRVVASGLLEEVVAAHERFADGGADGPHDLRVAMRRLRSWMRAFRPELSDTVRGRTRRRLRALAAATNEARDAEVMLTFIESQTRLPSRARASSRALADHLEHARDDHARELRHSFASDLTKAARGLETELEGWWERHTMNEPRPLQPMSSALSDAIDRHAKRVGTALRRIDPAARADDAHRARIAVKRLRYLLEPLDESFGAGKPIRQLRTLQRQLGDARDAHRTAMYLVREIGERSARDGRRRALSSAGIARKEDAAPAEPTVTRAGLTELARRAHAARNAALSEFETCWTDAEIAALVEQVRGIASRVAAG